MKNAISNGLQSQNILHFNYFDCTFRYFSMIFICMQSRAEGEREKCRLLFLKSAPQAKIFSKNAQFLEIFNKIFTPFYHFRRKILSRYKKILSRKTRAKILVFLTKKIKFWLFFVKIYQNFDENIRLRCRLTPQGRKIGNFGHLDRKIQEKFK